MGITVFFLIWGPFMALLFVPVTTGQQLRPTRFDPRREPAEPTVAAVNEFQPIPWGREYDRSRKWKNVA
jgi:hypothetical protein